MDYSIRTRSSRRRIRIKQPTGVFSKIKGFFTFIEEKLRIAGNLIDCPPTLGLLSMNSLCAADFLLVTLQSEYLAMEGLGQITEVVQDIKEKKINPNLELGGVVMTMYDPRTKLSFEVWQEVNKHYKLKTFRTAIPRNVKLSEAPSFGQTIFEYGPESPGALAYRAFCREFTSRLSA